VLEAEDCNSGVDDDMCTARRFLENGDTFVMREVAAARKVEDRLALAGRKATTDDARNMTARMQTTEWVENIELLCLVK
jgi:hypothetical protein